MENSTQETIEHAKTRIIEELKGELKSIKNSLPILSIEINGHFSDGKNRHFYVEAVSVEHALWIIKKDIVNPVSSPLMITSINIYE